MLNLGHNRKIPLHRCFSNPLVTRSDKSQTSSLKVRLEKIVSVLSPRQRKALRLQGMKRMSSALIFALNNDVSHFQSKTESNNSKMIRSMCRCCLLALLRTIITDINLRLANLSRNGDTKFGSIKYATHVVSFFEDSGRVSWRIDGIEDRGRYGRKKRKTRGWSNGWRSRDGWKVRRRDRRSR